MKQILRPLSRVAILAALVFSLVSLAQPTRAEAFSCFSDCNAAFQSCLSVCRSLPHQPGEGCFEFCQPDFLDCISSC